MPLPLDSSPGTRRRAPRPRLAPLAAALVALVPAPGRTGPASAPEGAPAVSSSVPEGSSARSSSVDESAARKPPPRRPDVVLVSFDTTRRDHVSCYGHDRLTTPAVDALARSGVRFSDCQAVIPVTGPSHASMLTGLYPQTHGAFRNGVPLGEGHPTLPEILRSVGYRTHAVVSGWTLRADQCGLDRGFDSYDDDGMDERYAVVNYMRRADDVTDGALAWVDRELVSNETDEPTSGSGEASESSGEDGSSGGAEGGRRAPYFLFVHYFDPHEPFESPLQAVPGPNPAADGGPSLVKHERLLPDYDREIAFADREMGRLLEGLRERSLLDDAIVVFTADHGQSFGEHGYGGKEGAHGRKVYQSTIAAPLVVSWPGRVPGDRVVDLPVSHLDLLPTIAGLAGVAPELLPLRQEGHDLSRVLRDPQAEAPWGGARRLRHAVAFGGAVGNKWNIFRWAMNKDADDATPRAYAVVDEGVKVIVNPKKPHRYEVYDLASDPGELRPIRGARRQRHAAWLVRLQDWYRDTVGELRDVEHDEDELEALRSLGYVGN